MATNSIDLYTLMKGGVVEAKKQKQASDNISSSEAESKKEKKSLIGNAVLSAILGTDASAVDLAGRFSGSADLTIGQMAKAKNQSDLNTLQAEKNKRVQNNLQQPILNTASKMREQSAEKLANAKQGRNKVGQAAADVVYGVTQLAGDTAMNTIVPGSGIYAMGLRSFDQGVTEAEENGKSENEQFAKGALRAATAMATGKILGSVGGKLSQAYGKGLTDDIAKNIANKYGKTVAGKAAILTGLGAAGEAIEEGTESLANNAGDYLIEKGFGTRDENEKVFDWKGAGYDSLIGGIIGGIANGVGSVNVARGMEANKAQPNATAERNGTSVGDLTAEQENAIPGIVEASTEADANAVRSAVTQARQIIADGGNVSSALVRNIAKDAECLVELGIDPNGKTSAQLREEVTAKLMGTGTNDVASPSANTDVLSEKRGTGESGWGAVYGTAQEAFNDALKNVNEELFRAFENAVNESASGVNVQENNAFINSFISAAEAVRHDDISPNTAAIFISQKYADGTIGNYVSEIGDLNNTAIEEMKRIDAGNENVASVSDNEDKAQFNSEKLTDDVLTQFNSTLDRNETSAKIQEIADMIESGRNADAFEAITKLSQDIIGSASVLVNGETTSDIKQIKSELRKTRIFVSKAVKGDFADYNFFRKHNFGKLLIVNDESAITPDVLYADLQNRYGYTYFPSDIDTPSDQLARIAYVLNEMGNDKYDNPYRGYENEANEECLTYLLESILQTNNKGGDTNVRSSEEVEGRTATDDTGLPEGKGYRTDTGLQNGEQTAGEDGLGGADAGTLNTPFQNMQAQSNEFYPVNRAAEQRTMQEQGRAPSDVPSINPETKKRIGKTISTLINSPITSNDVAAMQEEGVALGTFDHEVITDRQANTDAINTINELGGYKEAASQFIARAWFGKTTKNDMALGIACYNEAVAAGDNVTAYEIASVIEEAAHTSAQVVQATNLLNRLTPAGKVLALRKYLNKLASKKNTNSKGKSDVRVVTDKIAEIEERLPEYAVKMDEEFVNDYLMAENDADRADAWDAIIQDIASKLPPTLNEKWNTWRYTSMLFNPVTVIRNTGGNSVQGGLRRIKNAVGALLESKFVDDSERTKAILRNTPEDNALKSFAEEMYEEDRNAAMGVRKYTEGSAGQIASEVNSARNMFGENNIVGEGVQNAVDATQWLLNNEKFGDAFFNKRAYVDSLAQALKAKGITWEMAQSGDYEVAVLKSREYAVSEAAKATYRDTNAFSDFVSNLGKTGHKAADAFVDALLPFRRTPANILVRGTVDYSPVGIIKALTYDMAQVKKGNATAADVVDHISSGLTGTGILALGAYLASQGLLKVKVSDDDKENRYLKSIGFQDYSLQIGNGSYMLDWLVPAAIPLFAGAALYEGFSENGKPLESMLNAVAGMSDVVLETSMLQSIDSLFENMSYADNKLWYLVSSAITSYIGQAFPTIGGKIANVTDSVVRKAYTKGGQVDVASDASYFAQSILRKIPGARNTMQPSIDMWGNEISNGGVGERVLESFVSPGFYSKESSRTLDREIQRLAKVKGDSVYPTQAARSFSVNGKTVYLEGEQYTRYAKKLGHERYKILSSAINTDWYRKMNDSEKAEFVSKMYSYATAKAKASVSSYEIPSEFTKYKEMEDAGISPSEYYQFTSTRDIDGSGQASQNEAAQALLEMDKLSKDEKSALWQSTNSAWDENKNPFSGTLSQKGYSPETIVSIMTKYNELSSEDDMKAKEKTQQFNVFLSSIGLNGSQISQVKEVYRFYNVIPYTK